MSRSVLSFVLGFWSALGLLWLAKKHRRRVLYRLIGFEAELDAARAQERDRAQARHTLALQSVAAGLAEDFALYASGQDKEFSKLQLLALSLLNGDVGNSKNFTFWQRRTQKIREDLERLRAV